MKKNVKQCHELAVLWQGIGLHNFPWQTHRFTHSFRVPGLRAWDSARERWFVKDHPARPKSQTSRLRKNQIVTELSWRTHFRITQWVVILQNLFRRWSKYIIFIIYMYIYWLYCLFAKKLHRLSEDPFFTVKVGSFLWPLLVQLRIPRARRPVFGRFQAGQRHNAQKGVIEEKVTWEHGKMTS